MQHRPTSGASKAPSRSLSVPPLFLTPSTLPQDADAGARERRYKARSWNDLREPVPLLNFFGRFTPPGLKPPFLCARFHATRPAVDWSWDGSGDRSSKTRGGSSSASSKGSPLVGVASNPPASNVWRGSLSLRRVDDVSPFRLLAAAAVGPLLALERGFRRGAGRGQRRRNQIRRHVPHLRGDQIPP